MTRCRGRDGSATYSCVDATAAKTSKYWLTVRLHAPHGNGVRMRVIRAINKPLDKHFLLLTIFSFSFVCSSFFFFSFLFFFLFHRDISILVEWVYIKQVTYSVPCSELIQSWQKFSPGSLE